MLAFLYAFYGIAMVITHPNFIYRFSDAPFALQGYSLQTVETAAGAHRVAVTGEIGGGPVVLYFMGNVGALDSFASVLALHRNAGRTVVAMTYPGGGGEPGQPSEERLKAQALQTYDWVRAQTEADIQLHGYSIGTSLALYVASERDVDRIRLDAPFVRMCELMTRGSALPACYLLGVQKWDSAALIPDISAPVQIVHGPDDPLIPFSDGQRLRDLMEQAGVDVDFQTAPGGDHVNLMRTPGYANVLAAFLDG